MSKGERPKPGGVPDDWGKTKPFWCLTCGIGFGCPMPAWKHYETSGHENERRSIGVRGPTVKEQMMVFRLRGR